MITSTAKNPSHKYFPKTFSKWQYFFFREYPPGVKQSKSKYIASSLPRQLRMKLEFSGPVGNHRKKVAMSPNINSTITTMYPNFQTEKVFVLGTVAIR